MGQSKRELKRKFLVEMDESELTKMKEGSDIFQNCDTFEEVLQEVIGTQSGDYPGGPELYDVDVTELDSKQIQILAKKIFNKLNQKGAGLGNVSILIIKEVLDKTI